MDQSGTNEKRWKGMESGYAATAAAASVDSVHSRRCPPQDLIRPARYLNGVKVGRLRGGEHCAGTHQ